MKKSPRGGLIICPLFGPGQRAPARDWNDDIVDLVRIPVFWTEIDVAFHSLGSERAKGKGWVAP